VRLYGAGRLDETPRPADRPAPHSYALLTAEA
jgi:hypothetical protein